MSSEKTESADLFDLMAWIEVNKKRLAGVCVGIVVVGFGAYVYSWASERKEQQASAALLQLQVSHESSDEAKNVSAADYLKVAGAYGGTRAAERAALLAGESLFNEKKFTEAQAQFDKFRRDFADSVLVPEAAYGVAACLDAQNKLAEAATAYQDVLARYANSPVATQAKLALARVNEASGKPELALKVYDELANPASFNALASEANDRRDQLLAKHPELAASSTFQKPMSVTTNAAGQRITLTPVATTNAATATNTATKSAAPVELKVTPPAKPAK